MKNLKALQASAKGLIAKIEGLSAKIEAAEAAGKSEDVKTLKIEFDAAGKEFDGVEVEIAEAEAHAKRLESITKLDRLAAPAGAGKSEDGGNVIPLHKVDAEPKDQGKEEREIEGHFLDALDGKTIPDGAREVLAPKNDKWGENASKGVVLPRHLARAVLPEAFGVRGKALPMTSVGTSGSYITPREFHAELLRFQAENPALFPNVRQVPTTTGKADWPRLKQASPSDQYGGVICTWTGEGADKTDTESEIEQVQVDAYELSAYTELTRTLLRRSGLPLENLMQDLFRTSILGYLDAAILAGNGASKPLGLLDDSSGIETLARAEATKVSRDDLIGLKHAIPLGARMGACGFVVSDDAMEYMEKQVNAAGIPVHPVNATTGRLDSLVGKPILGVHSRVALGAAGDVIFGDPKQYIAAVDQEIVFASSDQYKFKSGRTAYVIFMLVGGKPGVPQAFVQLANPVGA